MYIELLNMSLYYLDASIETEAEMDSKSSHCYSGDCTSLEETQDHKDLMLAKAESSEKAKSAAKVLLIAFLT